MLDQENISTREARERISRKPEKVVLRPYQRRTKDVLSLENETPKNPPRAPQSINPDAYKSPKSPGMSSASVVANFDKKTGYGDASYRITYKDGKNPNRVGKTTRPYSVEFPERDIAERTPIRISENDKEMIKKAGSYDELQKLREDQTSDMVNRLVDYSIDLNSVDRYSSPEVKQGEDELGWELSKGQVEMLARGFGVSTSGEKGDIIERLLSSHTYEEIMEAAKSIEGKDLPKSENISEAPSNDGSLKEGEKDNFNLEEEIEAARRRVHDSIDKSFEKYEKSDGQPNTQTDQAKLEAEEARESQARKEAAQKIKQTKEDVAQFASQVLSGEIKGEFSEEQQRFFDQHEKEILEEIRRQQSEIQSQKIENLDGSKLGRTRALEKDELYRAVEKDSFDQAKEEMGVDVNLDGYTQFLMEKLNIGRAEILKGVPDFLNLSPGQQAYILNKIKERMDSTIQNKAVVAVEDSTKGKGFVRGLATSLKNNLFFGKTRTKSRIKNEVYNNTFEYFGEDIKKLTNYIDRRGVEIEYDSKENLLITKYISKEGSDDRHNKAINDFNITASRFSEIPASWASENAKAKERKAFKKAKEAYESAKRNLLAIEDKQALSSLDKKSENYEEEKKRVRGEVLASIETHANEVEFNRFLTQNPEIRNKALRFLTDSKLKERGAYGLSGFLARGGSTSASLAMFGSGMSQIAMSFGGGVLASAIIGGITGNRRERESIREKERMKSSGYESGKKGVREMIKADQYVKKINELIDRIESTKSEEKKKDLIQMLKNRIGVLDERSSENLINWGRESKQLENQMNLTEAKNKANRYLYGYENTDDEKVKSVYERFEQRFLQDEKVSEEKKQAIKKATRDGALLGAGLFTIGWSVRDLLQGDNSVIKSQANQIMDYFAKEDPQYIPRTEEELSRVFSPEASEADDQPKIITKEDLPPESWSADFKVQEVGSRGAIGAIDDLQEKIISQFEGKQVPPGLDKFVGTHPEDLAKEWGFYNPDEGADSAILEKGSKFMVSEEGTVIFEDADGKRIILSQGEKFNGDFVDTHGSDTSSAGNESVVSNEEAGPDFENIKEEKIGEGFTHERRGFNDVFSKEIHPQSVEPERVFNYEQVPESGVIEINEPEIYGDLSFDYGANGEIQDLDISKIKVDDVVRFRQNPANFMISDLENSDLKFATKSYGIKTLTNLRPQVEEHLIYKNILDHGGLNPEGDEYKYVLEKANETLAEIQDKSGGIFKSTFEEYTPSQENINIEPAAEKAPEEVVKPTPEINEVAESNPQIETEPEPELKDLKDDGTVEVLRSSPEEKLLNFETDKIKGKILFQYNEDGQVVDVQGSNLTRFLEIEGNKWEDRLIKGWESRAGMHSMNRATGLEKIRSSTQILIKYQAVLEDGGFTPDSEEYKFLNKTIELIKKEYRDVLRS